MSKAAVARKLAAIRSFYAALVRDGRVSANPADLVATPKQDKKLPRVLSREEVSTLLDRIPTRTPLELRDRAMLELAYSCGLRAEEVVNLDLESRLRRGAPADRGKGSGRPGSCPWASPPSALCAVISSAAGRARGGPDGDGAFRLAARPAALALGRPQAVANDGCAKLRSPGSISACVAPLVRHAPARGRGRPAIDPGAARATRACRRRRSTHRSNHPGCGARVRTEPSARLSGIGLECR